MLQIFFDPHCDTSCDYGDDSGDDNGDDAKPVVVYCITMLNSSSVLVRCPFCASSQEEKRSPLQCRGREEERAWDASDLFRYTP